MNSTSCSLGTVLCGLGHHRASHLHPTKGPVCSGEGMDPAQERKDSAGEGMDSAGEGMGRAQERRDSAQKGTDSAGEGTDSTGALQLLLELILMPCRALHCSIQGRG